MTEDTKIPTKLTRETGDTAGEVSRAVHSVVSPNMALNFL